MDQALLRPRRLRRPLILLSNLGQFGGFLFTLLGFFTVLGMQFPEPGPVIHLPTTSSHACIREGHTITIFLDAHNQFSVAANDSATQAAMIQKVARHHRVRFTPSQHRELRQLKYLNQDIERLPAWLTAAGADRQRMRAGISTSSDNDQLMEYVLAAQAATRSEFGKPAYIVLCIDQAVAAPRVLQLVRQLASHGIERYNLVGDYHDSYAPRQRS